MPRGPGVTRSPLPARSLERGGGLIVVPLQHNHLIPLSYLALLARWPEGLHPQGTCRSVCSPQVQKPVRAGDTKTQITSEDGRGTP